MLFSSAAREVTKSPVDGIFLVLLIDYYYYYLLLLFSLLLSLLLLSNFIGSIYYHDFIG